MVRRVARALVALMAMFALLMTVTLVQAWWAARQDSQVSADAIIVLGAAQYNGEPSPVLQARLDHTLALWQAERAPLIVVTGGRQLGDAFTEASSSAQYLIDRGVPDESILREVQGSNTWESLAASARILRDRDLDRVLLVSDSFHALRIKGIAESLGMDAHISRIPDSAYGFRSELRQLFRESAAVALGRVIGHQRVARWADRFL